MSSEEFSNIKIGDKFIINLNKNIIVTVISTSFKTVNYGGEDLEYPTHHILMWFNSLNETQQICMYLTNAILFTKVE